MKQWICGMYRDVLLALWLGCVLLHASAQEDALVLQGADSLYRGDFSHSFDVFVVLFDETKEPYYARLAAQAAMGNGDVDSAFNLAMLYVRISKDYDDVAINRILADGYVRQGDITQAIAVTKRIYTHDTSQDVGEVLGNLYMLANLPKQAQAIYQQLYNTTYSPELLQKLLLSLIEQQKEKQALSALSTHLLERGCEGEFCEEALRVYVDLERLDIAKNVFEHIYATSPTIPHAMLLMRVLIALKQFQKAQNIAESFPFDKGLLLDLYVMQGDYHKAQQEAKQLYQTSKNPAFLALEAIYEFSAQEEVHRAQAESIATRLQHAIALLEHEERVTKREKTAQDAFFYNFCGYLLIDYDIDVNGGMKYVQKALAIEPYSVAYVDSLAWGYYKLGECERAVATFAAIPRENIERDEDLRAHHHQIQGVCVAHSK